jgi:hypothetical protein
VTSHQITTKSPEITMNSPLKKTHTTATSHFNQGLPPVLPSCWDSRSIGDPLRPSQRSATAEIKDEKSSEGNACEHTMKQMGLVSNGPSSNIHLRYMPLKKVEIRMRLARTSQVSWNFRGKSTTFTAFV